MKRRSLVNIFAASTAAFMLVFSLSANAFAWNNDPFADNAVETTTTTAEDENPEDIVLEEEDIEEEIPEETTAAPETMPATEETVPSSEETTTAPAETTTEPVIITPVETTQQASYNAVDSYTMYAPQVINIRSGPGTDYDKVGVLYTNAAVTVVGTNGDWLAISYNGQNGFVLGSLLSATEPQTTTTAADVVTQPQETEPVTSEEAAEMTETPITEPVAEVTTTTSKAPETTPASQTTKNEAVSSAVTTPFPPVLLALLCAVGVFLVVAVIPITIHKLHHRKLYRY